MSLNFTMLNSLDYEETLEAGAEMLLEVHRYFTFFYVPFNFLLYIFYSHTSNLIKNVRLLNFNQIRINFKIHIKKTNQISIFYHNFINILLL